MGYLQDASRRHRAIPRLQLEARQRGFTLIELLVAVSIIGILMAVGVPSMMQFLSDRAASANAQEFADAVRFTRTEAMKRGGGVSICATDDPEASEPDCSDTATWAGGWLVIASGSNRVLRRQNALRSMDSLESDALKIDFASTGIVTAGDGDYVFHPVGDSDSKRQRTVSISRQGAVSITVGAGS